MGWEVYAIGVSVCDAVVSEWPRSESWTVLYVLHYYFTIISLVFHYYFIIMQLCCVAIGLASSLCATLKLFLIHETMDL